MTNVRYLLVGVAGMVFALAVGVLLGAGPMQGDVDQRLQGEIDQLGERQTALEQEKAELVKVGDYHDAFAGSVTESLVTGTLTGRQVVLVALPGSADSLAEELEAVLDSAGATVTGVVRLEPKWAEPGQQQFLEDLTARLVTEDTEFPEGSQVYDRAGTLLARALLTDDDRQSGTSDDGTTAILGGLAAGELLRADDELPRGDLAVVLAPSGSKGSAASEGAEPNAPWVALARALDRGGSGVVVAGDTGESGGVVAAVRDHTTAGEDVSSVDVADRPSGRVGVVLALAEQLAGEAGHYGTAGSDGVRPELPSS